MISNSKLRAVALSLLVLFTMAVTLPWPGASAHNKGRAHMHHRHRHSRAWWRKYRARMRRQRAAIARRNALTAMRGHSSVTESTSFGANTQRLDSSKPMSAFGSQRLAPSSISTGGVFNDPRNQLSMMMPNGWSTKPVTNNSGETKFKVFAPDGRAAGQAELAVVAASAPSKLVLPSKERNQMLGGVTFATLRRRVIDRMINEGGWVINDLQKDVNGRRAYVVLAQTPASKDGRTPAQVWTFYFTEVDGRIYSFSTVAAQEFSDQMSQGSEHVISSLRSSAHPFAEETSRR